MNDSADKNSDRRDRQILQVAEAEVTPAHVNDFAPITRGPLVAMAGLFCLGLAAAFYIVGQKALGLFDRSRRA